MSGVDYTRILRYCSANGTAVGLDFVEAAIHAINERIERDAESMFLVRTFLRNEPEPIRLVDPSSLPRSLRRLLDKIEEVATDQLLIIDITTDLSIPAFCVLLTRQKRVSQPRGCGCSLSKEYALERALLEALQDFHIQERFPAECDADHTEFLQRLGAFPKYQSCARTDLMPLVKQGFWRPVRFDEIVAPSVPTDVDTYLDKLLEILTDCGFQPFYSIDCRSRKGLTCLNVLVPGLESFHLVKAGNAVLPGRRGSTVVRQSRLFGQHDSSDSRRREGDINMHPRVGGEIECVL